MTRQEADFDADLDFDRFGMTGSPEEGLAYKSALSAASKLNG